MQINSRNITIAFSILIAGAILWYFREIVSYILIAWIVSMLGQPLMQFYLRRLRFNKFKAGESLCAALTLVTFLVAIVALISFFIPLLAAQANNLSHVNYTDIGNSLQAPLSSLNAYCQKLGILQPNQTVRGFAEKSFIDYIDPARISAIFGSFVSIAGSLAVGLISVLFISFFFLKEKGMLTEFIASFFPAERDAVIQSTVADTTTLLSRYFSGILLQTLFIAAFLSVGLMIAGVGNAILIAMFAAIINVIPYLGPTLGALFACFITISSNVDANFYHQTAPLLIRVGVVFACMQLFNDFFVSPAIFSNRVRAHPLEIFIVVLAGAKIGGVMGMLIAIPVYTTLRVVARAFFNHSRFVQKMTVSLDQVVVHRTEATDILEEHEAL